ncbi:hypothetical protein CH063_00568 [Colletotrichum higginsianum]|uniref:Secreted protein n=1 Tax=Colletotrichum higginsianum (strain IMI 349063) TaxID=759273 RepID=H1VZR2_COLHI|nr:hypothetical protein CH63R_01558 [Colletotrichum higginsianum IMI 349063]OBR16378.1 hypothetical protein CH63R_01558 [Colletotrichum higginsianum IMI 349063]CCF45724.1 hypothetical protein CH063_00568 [Colletotrichum higginsianum]
MKTVHTAICSILAILVSQGRAISDILTLPTTGDAYIEEARATLVLPKLPDSVKGDLAIRSGIMMNDKETFIQGVASNSATGSYCNDGGKKWCTFAYTMTDKLNSKTQIWTQNVYVDGKISSSDTNSKGQVGNAFYLSILCADGNACAELPAHSWKDVSVVLNKADKDFGRSKALNFGATGGDMTTTDGGKTWKFETIKVPAQKAS